MKYLASLGYRSSNDRKFPQVLRFLGLTDGSGRRTLAYRSVFRQGKAGRARLAQIVRDRYAALFGLYPDAHRKDSEAIQNFFRAHTDVGPRAIQGMASTFQAICSLADFEAEAPPVTPQGAEEVISAPGTGAAAGRAGIRVAGSVYPLTINVNIQLELPATTEADVYDTLFKSMAEHIFAAQRNWVNVQDVVRWAAVLKADAARIAGSLESAKARRFTLDASYRQLGELSLKQDDLFRQALRCVEHELYRAAHVMAWAAFMDLLHETLSHDSVAALHKARPAWKVNSSEDLRVYSDCEVILAVQQSGLVSKTVAKALHGLLNKRNECAHPEDYFPGLNDTSGTWTSCSSELATCKVGPPGDSLG